MEQLVSFPLFPSFVSLSFPLMGSSSSSNDDRYDFFNAEQRDDQMELDRPT